jgi:trehalose synthase
MLPIVKTEKKNFDDYKNLIEPELFKEVKSLAKDLKSLKVVMINATPRGGGVAEILKSLIPLMNNLGIQASWQIIPPREEFFNLTKEIHNALQGKTFSLSYESRKLYQHYIEKTASLMIDEKEVDFWVMHDPQPAGLIQYLPDSEFDPVICRIHIDTTSPNKEAWNFIKGFLAQYDKLVFSSKDFIHPDIANNQISIIPPAIDPFTEKNKEIDFKEAKDILSAFGVDVLKPLITQVSRFDPWKDPIGVIQTYRKIKEEIPEIQLAYLGLFLASDDPEAEKVFEQAKKEANKDKDIFLFSNTSHLGSLSVDRFVNAFQTASDVILQKSIREGFGLTVTEAMWKGTPVVGGNVGGIKLQIEDGKNGYLVSNIEQAAKKTIKLLKDNKLRARMGKEAKESVRKKFLIPRLLRDYLKLFKELS